MTGSSTAPVKSASPNAARADRASRADAKPLLVRQIVQEAVRRDGTQKNVVDLMQSRSELYDYLDYHAYETKLDQLFAKERS